MPSNRWLRVFAGVTALALVGAFAVAAHRMVGADRSRTEPQRASGSVSPTKAVPEAAKPAAAAALAGELPAPDAAGTALSDDERKYIWDIEHVALVLDVHVFPQMAKTIREENIAGLMEFVSDEFDGRIPKLDRSRSATYAFGEFRWLTDQDDAWEAANRQQFLTYLFSQRALFPEPPKVEIRLMKLSPVDRAVRDGPWHGTMKIRLAGAWPEGRRRELEMQAHFALDAPSTDLRAQRHWLRSCGMYSWRSNETSHALMKEVAAERGIDRRRFHDNWDNPNQPPKIAPGGVYLCDFNKDGWLDVLVTDVNELVLYAGQPDGQFRDVTAAAGLTGPVQQSPWSPAVFVDLDGDGYEDLIVGTRVFRNKRDGTFDDVTALCELKIPADARGFAVADYDLDGRMDVYIVRTSPGPVGRSRVSWVDDQTGPGNQLWQNLGGWSFRNVTNTTRTSAGHRSCFAAVWLDADGDGRPDLAVSDEFGSSVLLVNHADGRFTEHPVKPPFAGFCMGIVAGDFDNDGRPDLYLANMFSKAGERIIANLPEQAYTPDLRARIKDFVVGSELLRNKGDLTFEPMGRRMGVNGVGWAYGPNMVDLNNDGWLDLYAPAGFLSYTRGEPDG